MTPATTARSRYGYVYLLKHKHEVFETFKVFKNEVENQLGKTIKALRSDRGGEYISQEFKDYLKACGIFQQLTPLYTPQHNRVFERKNRTLLDMVRSMMNLTTMPLSFWGYALETATRILNMVPTKKVDKTPYELWTHQAPDRLCLNVEVEEHSLGDLNEPPNYKAAIIDLDFDNWVDAMNVEMHSIKDNQVWHLVDLPPNCKTVRRKWLFKKKTNMDDNVHTYKSRLVAKGFTQTYGINYEETFSPIDDIRAIRILIAITSFYDYEIWKMDIKTAFLNGYLNEDIFMVQPESFVDPNHLRKVCKLQRSIYGLKQASRSWNKRFDEEIKRMDNSKRGCIPMQEKLDLNKTQGASTPEEEKHMQNFPYALALGSIMYAYLRNTKDMFLVYGGNPEVELRVDCYCNAGFKTDRENTKFSDRSSFKREKLSSSNFNDWFHSPKMVLRVDKKRYVIEQHIPLAPPADSKYLRSGMRFMMLIMRFVRNYNMHNMGKTIGELHALLIEYEKGLPKKAATP
ncbi:retrotransposon protein, putative, ty1-copia subclass [Tanacetum coccineum]